MASCEDCNNKGWVLSNDEDWNDEIQKCDSCSVFAHDEEAQMFVHFLGFDDEGENNEETN
mgnify:FL=1|jgi:hypothetical protein|tara:strand:- start:1942 stop:2121 length:180 start_codon:yes stop_codon:yes gene_type:complete